MHTAYLPKRPQRVLVLGSGALQIGQAGEFDYSGSQAIKALKEEGIFTVLVNPNIATIQTSTELADRVYLVDLNPEFVEQVIVKEQVDGILLSFGGQTALNCGVALHHNGVFARHAIQVLGSPIGTICDTEDRRVFAERLREIGVLTPRSRACQSPDEAHDAAKALGFPVMLRAAFSLGGQGSGIAETPAELDEAVRRAFSSKAHQVLVEESLRGWKEIEYEVVRDCQGNCITVCNMENVDPLGIHTGESIVVAPSQTLNDEEYHRLRTISIRTIRHLNVVGECNIQFALDPRNGEYRVIEVNARLSRSSALASKATGYPLAYVAAKLGLGYALPQIQNAITRRTTAFFEPALDYLTCKVPRWDLAKFSGASTHIGSEMKSVGEVMAIGRTFPEVIQKALRMLDIGVDGLHPEAFLFEDIETELRNPSPERIFAIAQALRDGRCIEEISAITGIDPWFLQGIESVVHVHGQLLNSVFPVTRELLEEVKKLGFSDCTIERLTKAPPGAVREFRHRHGVVPHVAQIDTMAAEFPADTNYLYCTYHATKSDVKRSSRKKILVLGSGPYRIGSSVEFDWCCVSAVRAAAELGYETIMMNCNPETVSTDYDVCDRLFFEEISLETVLEVCDQEEPSGVIVGMGGQISNSLAIQLDQAGVKLLGTSAESIDRAEDRRKFSSLLDRLGIDQPRWAHVTDVGEARAVVQQLGGFPVLVRPSYVLSGAAMSVAREEHELARILARAKDVSREHPVVVSKFETHAREVEIDAVADEGALVLWAVSEHIEDAGVHSGDATLVLPPQTLYISVIRRCRQIAAQLARALRITGPFNVQFLAKQNFVKVIECNLRASRSFPFVSKVTGQNFAAEAVRRMLGVRQPVANHTLDLDYVGVKAPQFSFSRLVGADPMLGVEMMSTGEVGCLGGDIHEALLHGLLASGFRFPRRGVVLSLGPVSDKYSFTEEARVIHEELGLPIYATEGTAEMLQAVGVPCIAVAKTPGNGLSAARLIEDGMVDLVVNVPREYDEQGRPDGYLIRRRCIDMGIPLFTDLPLARAVIEALRARKPEDLQTVSLNDYLARGRAPSLLN